MTRTIDLSDDGETLEITADRNELYRLRNALFSGYYDGRFPEGEGEELRTDIPEPNDTLESATFRLGTGTAKRVADCLEEGRRHTLDSGRDSTARRIEDIVARFRFLLAAPDVDA